MPAPAMQYKLIFRQAENIYMRIFDAISIQMQIGIQKQRKLPVL